MAASVAATDDIGTQGQGGRAHTWRKGLSPFSSRPPGEQKREPGVPSAPVRACSGRAPRGL